MSFELSRDRAAAFDQTIAGAMSRELHKTAQPLTILQGLLEFMAARVSTGDDCKTFLERAGKEAPRLAACDECRCFLKRAGEELPRLASCFEDVRKLAGLQRPARDVAEFPLLPLVTDVLQTLRGDLDISVVFDAPRNGESMKVTVNASHSRVFTAVRLVLTTLVDGLSAGDRIDISLEMAYSSAVLRFRPSRQSPLAGAEHDSLLSTLTSQLEFAELQLASVGGELRVDNTPDMVVVSLPAVVPLSDGHDRAGEKMHV